MSEQASQSCRPERPGVTRSESSSAEAGTDVATRLRGLVSAHLDVDPVRLRPDTRLGEDLCVDSLAAIELTMVIEDEFDIALPEEVVADVRTYGDVLTLVSQRAGGAQDGG